MESLLRCIIPVFPLHTWKIHHFTLLWSLSKGECITRKRVHGTCYVPLTSATSIVRSWFPRKMNFSRLTVADRSVTEFPQLYSKEISVYLVNESIALLISVTWKLSGALFCRRLSCQ